MMPVEDTEEENPIMGNPFVGRYREYLASRPGLFSLKKYDDRLRGNGEACISEAIVFAWLKMLECNPEINEDASAGGADFICSPDRDFTFIVEVTCLGVEALTKATGCHMISGQMMALKSPTEMIRGRVVAKAKQLSQYEIPTVLVITSLHDGAGLNLNPREAEKFFVSDWAFSFPMGGPAEDGYISTDLRQAIFFKPDKKNPLKIIPCRQSVSAVLLMPVYGDRVTVSGILHPEPEHRFESGYIPGVPFLRVRDWPIDNGQIFTEWIIHHPYPGHFLYSLDGSFLSR